MQLLGPRSVVLCQHALSTRRGYDYARAAHDDPRPRVPDDHIHDDHGQAVVLLPRRHVRRVKPVQVRAGNILCERLHRGLHVRGWPVCGGRKLSVQLWTSIYDHNDDYRCSVPEPGRLVYRDLFRRHVVVCKRGGRLRRLQLL